MKLSVKISGAVILFLAPVLGAIAWSLLRYQEFMAEQEAAAPGETVALFHAIWPVAGALVGVTVLLVYLIHFLCDRIVLRPIREAAEIMGRLAADPMSEERLHVTTAGDLGGFCVALNGFADSVRDFYQLFTHRIAERTTGLTQSYADLAGEMKRRQAAQEELAATNARLRAVLDAATQVAIIATDVQGVVTLFNPGAERMLGYSADEVVGRHTTVLIHVEEEIERHGRELTEQLGRPVHGFDVFVERARNGDWEEREWTYVRKDGMRLTVSLAVTPIRDGKLTITGYLKVAVDVTERRRAAEAMRLAKEAAEAANRAKSEFLANMSHEIRTPMNGIIGMTELALGTGLNSEQREYLELVKNSADSLLAVINDILDFSKIEAGKLDLAPIDFVLRDTLADAIKPLGIRAYAKNLELTLHASPDVPDFLIGDPCRLRQILVNLVGNAVKFTECGEVAVRVSLDSLGGEQRATALAGAQTIHFEVQDTGIGIPPEKLPHIFEPFVQADSSTTRKYGGTGLGLTITSRLVEMMGGRIWVESVPGRGSTFHFTARFQMQGRSPSKLLPQRPVGLENLSVLVVDDNSTNRLVLQETLVSWLMRPIVVEDARTALSELERAADQGEPFPLMLLDACMPEMDGFMLAEEIRRRPPLAGVVIMMLSSADRQGDGSRCRDLDISLYLTKPIKQADLRDALMKALQTGVITPPPRGPAPEKRLESAAAPTGTGLRILLAEDNMVNQKLAVRLLEKQNHRMSVVEDGAAAVRAVDMAAFDLVLMDVQMPRMGGLEATALIRERERVTGQHIPIVAMTARAMKGDREECLAAGMDGYISKPIDPHHLFQVIAGVLQGTPVASSSSPVSIATAIVFDPAAMRERLGDDDQLLRELVELFQGDCPRLLQRVAAAIRSNDPEVVYHAAHTLKGSVSNFGASDAVRLALRLETMGQERNLTGAEDVYEALEAAVRRLQEALDQWLSVSA